MTNSTAWTSKQLQGRFAILLLLCIAALGSARGADSGSVFSHEGTYASPTARCMAELRANKERGGTDLFVFNKQQQLILSREDVNAAAWHQNILYFSASPVYGKPGLFSFDCRTSNTRTLAKAQHKDAGYPDGSDYFELSTVKGATIEYLYFPDVDKLTHHDQLQKKQIELE